MATWIMDASEHCAGRAKLAVQEQDTKNRASIDYHRFIIGDVIAREVPERAALGGPWRCRTRPSLYEYSKLSLQIGIPSTSKW